MKTPVLARALVLGTIALLSLSASAQQIWKWRDANGEMHISDQPPPAGASVIARPATTAAPTSPEPAAAPAPAATPKAAVDPELAKRKAEADKKRAEQDQAQQAARKAQEAQQCAAAQEQLRTIGSGVRLMRVNAQGEREYLDDNAKAEQAKQAQAVVDRTCK